MPLENSRAGQTEAGGAHVMHDASGNDAAYLKPQATPTLAQGWINGTYYNNGQTDRANTGGGWLSDTLDNTVGKVGQAVGNVVNPVVNWAGDHQDALTAAALIAMTAGAGGAFGAGAGTAEGVGGAGAAATGAGATGAGTASGLAGDDLTQLDFKDTTAVEGWNHQHFQEHLAQRTKYGI